MLTFREHWESRFESQPEMRQRRMFSATFLRQNRVLSGDDRVFLTSFSDEAPSIAPTSAPTVAKDNMVGDVPLVNNTSSSNAGIIAGSVIGGLVGGMLVMAAIVYVKRPLTPTPLAAVASRPAAPPSVTLPAAPSMMEDVPSAPIVTPSVVATSVTDAGPIVLYKDQCQSVAKPPSRGSGNAAAALPPPLTRVSAPATDRGGSSIPFAVAVAMAPPSAMRPPLDP
jgi:hypothetical protein